MRHITFVEQFYFPEGWGGAQLPRDITVDLSRAGHRVTVLCGKDQYAPVQGNEFDDPRQFGVSIRYVPRFLPGGSSRKGIVGQLWFCVATIVMILSRRWPSVLIVQTNPPLIVIALSVVATVLRRPLIIIAQDIYPELLIANRMMAAASLGGRLLKGLFRWAYRRATIVVSLGPKMTSRLQEKGVPAGRIREISNWATGDMVAFRGPANKLTSEWNLSNKFVLVYSGNLGIAHDANTVVRAIAAAKSALPQLRLLIVGNGRRVVETQRLVQELGLAEMVVFKAYVPLDDLPHTLGAADLALVTLLPGFEGLVVPSKLLGHMARGIPTLYVGPIDGDVAELISKSGGGVSIANGDVSTLAARLVELSANRSELTRMGISAAEYYSKHLTREMGLNHYRTLVESVMCADKLR
jgi:colanic acid biosynthesis glycosyl transferase WcaI